MRIPISLIIDDGTCVNPMYWSHPEQIHKFIIPNKFTNAFAVLCRRFGVKGKFSVLPIPSGLGRLDDHLNYVPQRHLTGFIKIVREQIAPWFDITPELLTHDAAYNLKNGSLFHVCEDEWVKCAKVPEMIDYLSLAFRILRNVGLTATGVTSPWNTGIHNETEYAEAVGRAYYRVFRRKFTWYFLHCIGQGKPRPPWISWRDRRQGLTVASVPALTDDPFWGTMRQSTEALARRAALRGVDGLITPNGRQGRLRELFDGGYPLIMVTHWQSLFAEGRSAGLDGLEELLVRIDRIFGDRVEWVTLSELAKNALPTRKCKKFQAVRKISAVTGLCAAERPDDGSRGFQPTVSTPRHSRRGAAFEIPRRARPPTVAPRRGWGICAFPGVKTPGYHRQPLRGTSIAQVETF